MVGAPHDEIRILNHSCLQRSDQHQNAMAVARATAERKLAASLSWRMATRRGILASALQRAAKYLERAGRSSRNTGCSAWINTPREASACTKRKSNSGTGPNLRNVSQFRRATIRSDRSHVHARRQPGGRSQSQVRFLGFRRLLARPKGFEPLTPRFVVWCSIQLSYGRVCRGLPG